MASIPSQCEFTIDEIGENTADPFRGRFTLKTILTHKEQLRRDEMRRLYLGSFSQVAPSPRAANQAELFADINIRIVGDKGCPSWWRDADMGLDLKDDAPVLAIVKELNKGIAEREAAVKAAIEEARKDLKGAVAAQQ